MRDMARSSGETAARTRVTPLELHVTCWENILELVGNRAPQVRTKPDTCVGAPLLQNVSAKLLI